MRIASRPENEPARLDALYRYGILDTLQEQAFDDIATLASHICETPIALISFIDSDRLWFKSSVGIDASEAERDIAFCAHAIQTPGQVFVVGDTLDDERFRENPLVTNGAAIRFYAGAPIVTRDGFPLGTVCTLDRTPRQLSERQSTSLLALSRLVGELLESGRLSQQRATRAIDNNRQRMESLLTLTMDGLELKAFIDREYVYRYLNQTFLDYWNRPFEQVVNQTVESVVGAAAFANIQPMMARALTGEQVSFFTQFDYPTKGLRQMHATYVPARDADGEIIGIVIRVNDLQDLRDSEEKLKATVALLEERNLAQQRFIQILSHDLREPLNTIVNFASLLDSDHAAGLTDQGRHFLGYVRNGGTRMRELLDDLLDFVRIDRAYLEMRPVDLGRVMSDVRDDLADAIARARATVEWAQLPDINGERSMIRILLQNMVANAIKFTRLGVSPAVHISAHAAGDAWEIRVQDNGIGIPENKLEKIFDMFARLHSRKDFDGTGLGLATCRRIVELHHGRIRVSSALGKGSCFHITLPQLPPAAATHPENK